MRVRQGAGACERLLVDASPLRIAVRVGGQSVRSAARECNDGDGGGGRDRSDNSEDPYPHGSMMPHSTPRSSEQNLAQRIRRS